MTSDIDTVRDWPSNQSISCQALLVQARESNDPSLDKEFQSFVRRSSYLTADDFQRLNVLEEPPTRSSLDGIDVLFVGGSGRFSVASANFEGHDAFLELMEAVVEARLPTFASCFGFHALVKSMGGQLEKVEKYAEIGTFDIHLNDHGRRDPLFGQLPDTFPAQLGHNDSVVELPDSLVRLASSDACPVQAVRFPDEPIFATQFHPELTDRDNMKRYIQYLENYEDLGELDARERRERAEALHRPSPESNRLVDLFLESVLEPD